MDTVTENKAATAPAQAQETMDGFQLVIDALKINGIDTIFGLPGIGRYFVQGALNRDYTLVMGVVICYAALIILLNFVADLLIAFLDPRVRLS